MAEIVTVVGVWLLRTTVDVVLLLLLLLTMMLLLLRQAWTGD